MTESSNKIDDLDEAVSTPARTNEKPRAGWREQVGFIISIFVVGVPLVWVFEHKVYPRLKAEDTGAACVEAQDEVRDLLGQAPDGDTAISDTLTADLERLNLELRDVCSYNETVVFEVEEVFPWFGETPPSTDSPAPTDTES